MDERHEPPVIERRVIRQNLAIEMVENPHNGGLNAQGWFTINIILYNYKIHNFAVNSNYAIIKRSKRVEPDVASVIFLLFTAC